MAGVSGLLGVNVLLPAELEHKQEQELVQTQHQQMAVQIVLVKQ